MGFKPLPRPLTPEQLAARRAREAIPWELRFAGGCGNVAFACERFANAAYRFLEVELDTSTESVGPH